MSINSTSTSLITNMFFLTLLTFVQADLLLKDNDYYLHIYVHNGNYCIFTREGQTNFTRYSYPIETKFRLAYDGSEYRLNDHAVYIENKSGTLTPPTLVQQIFSPKNDPCPINTPVPPPLQVCYDFSTERITLKAVTGFLVFLVLISNGSKIRSVIETVGPTILQSKLARRLSRTRSSVGGSQNSYTTVEKETGV